MRIVFFSELKGNIHNTQYDTRTVQYFHVSSLLYKRSVCIQCTNNVCVVPYLSIYKYISWRSSIFFSCELTAQRRRTSRVKFCWMNTQWITNHISGIVRRPWQKCLWIRISIHKKSVCCLLAFYSDSFVQTVMHVMSRISLFILIWG